jgi:multicomponent Na+:H+ antiporter subunit B
MNTLIFRTVAPAIVALMLVFSVFVLLRGHNEPGGGFIGGLVAAAAIAVYGIANGVEHVRRALRVHPVTFAGFGLLLAAGSGFVSYARELPYLTGLWWLVDLGGTEFSISTPGIFDIGIYFVVFGTMSAIALALESDRGEG